MVMLQLMALHLLAGPYWEEAHYQQPSNCALALGVGFENNADLVPA